MSLVSRLVHPVVQAPMAGGPSTPDLAAAVSNAGGLGFLAAGYLTSDALRRQIDATRALTDRAFGVNVFVPAARPADIAIVREFEAQLAPWAAEHEVALGEPRFDDDDYDAKLAVVGAARPAVVSFAFGCPARAVVSVLQAAGIEVWVTVTEPSEAVVAINAGADALVAQGSEAGAHRASYVDDDREPMPLQELLRELRAALAPAGDRVAVIAAGGLMDGADINAVLRLGAAAAQLGTAFLLCPEAGTNATHRRALTEERPTILTRAFTGRRARALVNAWTARFTEDAPRAYPEIHHLTAPLRARGRELDDPDLINLWAGTGHTRARAVPAAALVAALAGELSDD